MALGGCQYADPNTKYPGASRKPGGAGGSVADEPSIFGTEGLSLAALGGGNAPTQEGGGGIGVNSYLWRASLDTVSFMPLLSADPFGGVIITDWYSPPESPNERFKLNIYILSRELRADGLRTAVFRQVFEPGTGWHDAPTASSTATALENAILKRARQMRIAQLGE
ncbi:MAG: DUF3576 domain-containing protein [Rhodospirillaceae bacterium]|nr:DUF3576 domain-containing protein [Rhodospirillaceae bacterium]